jgi:PAS domain S-box-containing protein
MVLQMNASSIATDEFAANRSSSSLRLIHLRYYALAILSVGIALAASLVLEHFHFRVPSALLLLFAVTISSWYGGRGPAVLAFVLSTIGFYWYFVEPVRTIYVYRSEIPFFIVFTAFVALLSWFGTVRRRAEAALRRSEQTLRDAIDAIPVNAWSSLPDGSVDFMNQRAVDFTGLPRESALSWGWGSAMHPDDLPKFLEKWRTALSSGEPMEGEARLRRGDGAYHWWLIRNVPLRDELGKIVKWYGTGVDIQDRKQADEALRRSETYLAEAQRLSKTGSWATNGVYWSEEMFRIFGFDPQEGIPPYEMFWQRIHPEDRDWSRKTVEKALGEKAAFELDHRLVLPDSTVKHIHVIAHPVFDERGNVIEHIGTSVDVTEQKRAEEALRRSEAYLAEAQRLSKTGSWVWNPQAGKLVHWSEELFRITGFDPKEGLPDPESLWQRIHPEDRREAAERRQKAVQNKTEYTHDYRIVLPDGTIKHLHVIGRPMLNDAGEAVEFIGTTIDVTERKRAEAELRELIDAIPQQVFVFGSDWSPLFANSQEREYTGLSPEEARSKNAVARIFHPEDLKKLEVIRERALVDCAPCEIEARIRGKDGRYRWFLIRDNPLRDEQGDVIRWYGTRTDIQERKEAEQALHQAQAELERVNRIMVMGEMAASIAHEINQPLTGVVAHAGTCLRWLAAQPPDVEEARQYLGLIVRDGNRAADVIRGVRAFVKKVPPRRNRLDINEVVREVIALTHNELQRKSVRLHADLASDLPLVAADRVQLQQVILNLIVNAKEAMAEVSDRPREMVLASGIDDSNGVFVEVRDSGPGFDPANLNRLFDSFYTTKPGGMGMGLSISRSIVEAHGGKLSATANRPHGAVFRFTLPVGADTTS